MNEPVPDEDSRPNSRIPFGQVAVLAAPAAVTGPRREKKLPL